MIIRALPRRAFFQLKAKRKAKERYGRKEGQRDFSASRWALRCASPCGTSRENPLGAEGIPQLTGSRETGPKYHT